MRPLSIAAATWLFALLVMGSDSGVSVIGFFLYVYGAAALLVWWLVRIVRFVLARRRRSDLEAPPRWQWLVVPLCLVAAAATSAVEGARNPLFLLRFRLSEPAFRREAEGLLRSPRPREVEERWVGLFRVQRSTVLEGQVRFITVTCGVIDSCGIVYSPDAPPKRWQEDTFSRLDDRWWHLYERF